MAKKINATAEPLVFVNGETGEEITIEFNRAIVLRMEREGYSGEVLADEVRKAPISTLVDLFYYGMLMHQPDTTKEQATDFFFDNIGANTDVMERITQLFEKPYTDMMTAQRKNSLWTVK